jgi:hypothetical protein
MVHAQMERRVRVVGAAGIQLVDRPRIGAGTEVTRRTGLDAVASDLHVPEERLAQRSGHVAIPDVALEVRWFGNLDLREVPRSWVGIWEQVLRQFTRAFAHGLGRLRPARAYGEAHDVHRHQRDDKQHKDRSPDECFHDLLLGSCMPPETCRRQYSSFRS